jgi:hypothetical protein
MPTFTGAKAKLICSYMFKDYDKLFVTVLNGNLCLEPESGLFILYADAVEIGLPAVAVHAMKRIRSNLGTGGYHNKFFEIEMRKIEEAAACRNT